MTATYFLLAERKLRAQRQDTARRAQPRPCPGRAPAPGTKPGQAGPGDGITVTGADLSSLSLASNLQQPGKFNRNRVRKISIVEEEEEEEEDEGVAGGGAGGGMPARGLSRHSSTSSLADKATDRPGPASPQLHLDLTLAFAAQRLVEETRWAADSRS